MRHLRQEFQRRGPWVTCFTVKGQALGGSYHAEVDGRLRQFLEHYPRPGRVLELGCLEGGHTFPLARVAEEVVAIDSRAQNLTRAQWVAEQLECPNILWIEANLETFALADLGRFDVVFNVGLLYHLPRPKLLLERLAAVADKMYLWTHVAPEELDGAVRDGYRGMLYDEHGVGDPLSGMSESSFWPTLEELLRMLGDVGFVDCELLDLDEDHPHGPAVTLRCATCQQNEETCERKLEIGAGVRR